MAIESATKRKAAAPEPPAMSKKGTPEPTYRELSTSMSSKQVR